MNVMNADEYLKNRLDDQIAWYDRKSQSNQKFCKRLRITEFVLAAFIPFLSGFMSLHGSIQIVVGLIGVGIAIITASLGLYQFEQNWIEYRTTCESLKKEKYLYLTKIEPYDKDDERFALLVRRVETLISKENTNTMDRLQLQSITQMPHQ